MKSSRKSTDLTANTPYYSRPIRRIQDFDELKDQLPTEEYAESTSHTPHVILWSTNKNKLDLPNTPYPSRRYDISVPILHMKPQRHNNNTPYPGTSIRRIQDLLYTKLLEDIKRVSLVEPKGDHGINEYVLIPLVKMDDPNITMEEYIRLEEEKARRRAIVFNDTLTSEATLSCEPMVSSLNNDEIKFRISFDESDDEDCTVIFDKKSFPYKIISVNNLKMDSKNDNDKVNMPLLPSPEPTVSYFDDLDCL
ncbi:hypothetical protein Tco_0868917 [Tanacetum coccineum]